MAAPKGHPPYKGCETGGTPETYTDEIIEKYADELLEWIKDPSHIFAKQFSLEKMIHPDCMQRWSKKNEKFRRAYNISVAMQELKINQGALTKTFDSGFSKFLLINNHGYSDKTESKVQVEGTFKSILQEIEGKSENLVQENQDE